ncbi:MAG: hypothetical protein LBI60_03310 [Bacteroidales bacterium]|jgi:hypothetical protein|nr:hypothetical protein [Bacteroidales bacterium]
MKEKVIEWLFNGETGISSKTIAASILRVDYERNDIPHDKDDFSRCYKLIKFANITMSELNILSIHYPKWKPIVENWEHLIFRYENDLPFFDYLQTIIKKKAK